MNSITVKSVFIRIAVATAAFISLQSVAFAAISQHPAAIGNNVVDAAMHARLISGSSINNACDDTGLPCPRPNHR